MTKGRAYTNKTGEIHIQNNTLIRNNNNKSSQKSINDRPASKEFVFEKACLVEEAVLLHVLTFSLYFHA